MINNPLPVKIVKLGSAEEFLSKYMDNFQKTLLEFKSLSETIILTPYDSSFRELFGSWKEYGKEDEQLKELYESRLN